MKLFTIPPLRILYPSFSNTSATIATVASANLRRRTIFVVVVVLLFLCPVLLVLVLVVLLAGSDTLIGFGGGCDHITWYALSLSFCFIIVVVVLVVFCSMLCFYDYLFERAW